MPRVISDGCRLISIEWHFVLVCKAYRLIKLWKVRWIWWGATRLSPEVDDRLGLHYNVFRDNTTNLRNWSAGVSPAEHNANQRHPGCAGGTPALPVHKSPIVVHIVISRFSLTTARILRPSRTSVSNEARATVNYASFIVTTITNLNTT